jgi:hypothetical protein
MMETRSEGTGVLSLKLSANFFRSFNLTSLSFFILAERIWSTFLLSRAAKPLKALATACSTVAVVEVAVAFAFVVVVEVVAVAVVVDVVVDVAAALGVSCGFGCGEGAGLLEAATFDSGVATKLDSVVVGGVAVSALGTFAAGAGLLFSATGLSGRASCEDIIAGSTGAPLTVAWPVGARRAGGVYLLLEAARGGKSCLRTPLYL